VSIIGALVYLKRCFTAWYRRRCWNIIFSYWLNLYMY
jgi:hypothetical protein